MLKLQGFATFCSEGPMVHKRKYHSYGEQTSHFYNYPKLTFIVMKMQGIYMVFKVFIFSKFITGITKVLYTVLENYGSSSLIST